MSLSHFNYAAFLLELLFNLGSLTHAATQIVQLGAANLTVAHNLELRDVRGVYREGFLDAYTVGNTADGNRLVNAGVLLGNDDAFDNLNRLAVAFLNFRVSLNGIADLVLR